MAEIRINLEVAVLPKSSNKPLFQGKGGSFEKDINLLYVYHRPGGACRLGPKIGGVSDIFRAERC
jgi:hypothetical protein